MKNYYSCIERMLLIMKHLSEAINYKIILIYVRIKAKKLLEILDDRSLSIIYLKQSKLEWPFAISESNRICSLKKTKLFLIMLITISIVDM
jgi:hypothetical protein